MEIHALAARGWKVSQIARHTGRDRKTVAKYLKGEGAGQHRASAPSCLLRNGLGSGQSAALFRIIRWHIPGCP